MSNNKINYEFETKPDLGGVMEVVNGVHWLRMPLPWVLDHINLWLLQDDSSVAIVDTGVFDDANRNV